jgi:MarR family transcriptional regulator for hemolysin
VARVARQWRRAVDRRLQPFGLTEATWLPLIYVARAPGPMRQKDLAAALSLDGSSLVRLLDALAASGLVERREEEADRRAKTLYLTPRGRAIIDKVESVSQEVREAALLGLPSRDIEAVIRVLGLISANLARQREEGGAI